MRLRQRMTVMAMTGAWWLGGSAIAGQMIDNPMYEHWSKFKPGTYVVTRSVQEAAGQKTESEVKTELKSVTKEKVVLEMTSVTKMGDQEFKMPPQTMEQPAKYEKVEAPADESEEQKVKTETKEGEENIEVAGKKIKAKWYDSVTETGEMKTHSKSWTSDDMPGQVVKSIVRTEGQMPMNVVTEVIDFKVVK